MVAVYASPHDARLPARRPAPDRHAHPAHESPGAVMRVVLYVEDDPINAMLMQGIVELQGGCRVQVARSGAEAQLVVASQRVDMLLCDLRLPDTSGDKLLQELREAGLATNAPALLVTAEPEDVAADLARRGGFDGYWSKPLDVAATLRSLERWLD
jgi:two-component system cell cycle response regulator DivK